MKEIKIDSLTLGSYLSKDVYNDLGNIILSQGTEITKRHIDYFKKHGVDHVYLDEGPIEQPVLDKIERVAFNSQYQNVLSIYRELFYRIKADMAEIDGDVLKNELKPLIDLINEESNVFESIRDIGKIEDSYEVRHAVNVSILSSIMGKWFKMSSEKIYILALAGLLHDIGKSKIDDSILNKVENLNENELNHAKSHAKLGYELIKSNPTFSREVLAAVLFHHERCDGKGYPSGLIDEQIPMFAKIIAIADVFDALTSDRAYRKKVSSFKAFSIIKDESFSRLDPEISNMFLNKVAGCFVNNRVILNDGREGKVIYINKFALNRPLIKIDEEFVDLSIDYSLDIVDVI